MIKFALLWLIILAVLAVVIVYGARAIIKRRHDWAIADARWEVDVIPGKHQTDVMLQEVARSGKRCKILHSQLYRSIRRDDPHHNLEVEICKQEAQQYIDGTLEGP